MRIVAIADTHMFHADLEVPDGDVLVHAGDLCRGGTLEELSEALDWLRRLRHPTKLLVAGNHDWSFQMQRGLALELCGHDIKYLEDSGVVVGGLSFWGSPWQPAFNDWAFNLPRGEPLAKKWKLIPDSTDVLITHGPPAGIGDESSISGRQGCEDLRRRAEQIRPRLHLFGHIHDGGAWSRDGVLYANVTIWEGDRGATVVDVEAGSAEAKLVFAPPRQSSEPLESKLRRESL